MNGLWVKLKSVGFDRMLSNMKDYHIPIFVFMFLVGVAVAVYRPQSMSASFVGFTTAIVGGILGHAYSPYSRDGNDSSGSDSKSGDGPPQ